MIPNGEQSLSPPRIERVERKRVRHDSTNPVSFERVDSTSGPLPLVVRCTRPELNLASWMEQNHLAIEQKMIEHGGVLFRGFHVGGLEGFRTVVSIAGGKPEEYTYRSTPRTEIGGGIYTSTEYPAEKSIPFHNENAYADAWPRKLFFYCELPSAEGGETPIADSHKVFQDIPQEIRESFAARKVMYVRNYGEGIDLPWQEVFNTRDRNEVESYCSHHGIQLEWKEGDRLRTRQVCQAVATHPDTGQPVWFNQAHLFHISSMEPEVQEALREAFAEDELPRNAFYGDGSSISAADLDAVRKAYAAHEVSFPWQREDVLLVDNMAVAHARKPFRGQRKIRVAMTQPFSAANL